MVICQLSRQFMPENTVEVSNWLQELQDVIVRTYWWPTLELDGIEAVEYYEDMSGKKYFEDLQTRAVKYLEMANNCIRCNQISGRHLHKPNFHRILELYLHTIPYLRHGRNVSEMVFEHFHQWLKRSLRRNTEHNQQITAVENALARDWFSIIRMCMFYMDASAFNVRNAGYASLARLILGITPGYFKKQMQENPDDIPEKLHKVVKDLTEKNILSQMCTSGCLHSSWASKQEI